MLENPKGDMFKESAVIAQIACELNPTGGCDVIPKDPYFAAKMRL